MWCRRLLHLYPWAYQTTAPWLSSESKTAYKQKTIFTKTILYHDFKTLNIITGLYLACYYWALKLCCCWAGCLFERSQTASRSGFVTSSRSWSQSSMTEHFCYRMDTGITLYDTQVLKSFPALEDMERRKLVDIGTTDVSVKQQELLYVRVVDQLWMAECHACASST